MITRFSVAPLWQMTRHLAAVASGRTAPDLVITGARVLSTYTERTLPDREVWISGGRIAAVKAAGDAKKLGLAARFYDARGGILAPGLVDPHVHIESSMMTACGARRRAGGRGVRVSGVGGWPTCQTRHAPPPRPQLVTALAAVGPVLCPGRALH